MRISEILETAGVGLVVPGVNMPKGMHPDEIRRQAAKFGNQVSKDGVPPIASTNGDDALEEITDDDVIEGWSKKYKNSINCSNPKGFSQRAHCAARRKRQRGEATSSRSVNETAVDESNTLVEKKKKPKPTNPALWSRAKSAARSKFEVYPSAYANAWASKWYKNHGGGWRMG
jgi:hypothetical protein